MCCVGRQAGSSRRRRRFVVFQRANRYTLQSPILQSYSAAANRDDCQLIKFEPGAKWWPLMLLLILLEQHTIDGDVDGWLGKSEPTKALWNNGPVPWEVHAVQQPHTWGIVRWRSKRFTDDCSSRIDSWDVLNGIDFVPLQPDVQVQFPVIRWLIAKCPLGSKKSAKPKGRSRLRSYKLIILTSLW